MLKIAVVTPYHTESDAILRQCHDSVLAQTHECHHILVADGHAKPLFATSPRTLHLALPLENADNGNTPRAIGGLLADRYGFDAVAYLDADNWYDDDHIANMVAGHGHSGYPLVACKRRFCDLDGNAMAITEGEEERHRHVDTSCWMLCRPAFGLLAAWLMPKALSPVCDRIFFQAVLHARLPITGASSRTVNFRTRYALHYEAAGQAVPPGAKVIDGSVAGANAYLASDAGA
ncbi:hypothetical protein, partial [Beijerinckia sp. L45]|uniref:hypothetical protein n=1 Tax=Beijerinckia sp. L45 TaxID=1641855 RepID=UPI00131DB14D